MSLGRRTQAWILPCRVGYDGYMAQETKSLKGVVRDGGVVFEEGASLPEGTPVRITVESGRGSPQAVLEAMGQPPHVSEEDVAELVKELERGKRPIQFDSPLD